LTANAKLEALLKTKKALDMAKIFNIDMAAHIIMPPENMKHLVNSLVDQRIKIKDKQAQKQLTKDAIKEAQKHLWEGLGPPRPLLASTTMTASKKAFYGTCLFWLDPATSQARKKQNMRQPDMDYKQL
jgi:hypothetical protein